MDTPDFGSIPVRDNIHLRLLVPSDASAIFAILQKDPEIAQYYVTWTSGLKSEDEVRKAIEEYQTSRYFFGIISDEKLIGYIGTWKVTDHPQPEREEYDMGYFIDPDIRGTGIVTAAAQALVEVISKKLRVEVVDFWIWDENEASKAVARKLGARPTEIAAFDELLGVTDRCWQLAVKK
jgi:ribosomal-protein-serine acetyltransferase